MSNRAKITGLTIALVVVLIVGVTGVAVRLGRQRPVLVVAASAVEPAYGANVDADPAASVSDVPPTTTTTVPPTADPGKHPNVIVFLTDDADKKVMKYMPFTRKLIAGRGAVFPNYYVEQSLCCTSRATILTGEYSHNHGVRGNHYPEGGFLAFKGHAENLALPTWLQANDERTSLIGKYLNDYPYPGGFPLTYPQKRAMREYVPPGWNVWQSPVTGNPYQQFNYGENTNGVVDTKKRSEYEDREYGNRLLQEIHGADHMNFREGGKFVYYASYSPHIPFGHPKYLDNRYRHVKYPHTPNFNEADVKDKFGVARLRVRLNAKKITKINVAFRNRIRSVQVLDHTVRRTVEALKKQGTLDNTYLIFTSDNGYNMGEHRLAISKYNQYQETVNVPLYISGPGIAPHTVLPQLAGNVDLAPTIAAMTGTPIPDRVDGTSLLPLLHGTRKQLDRHYLLISRGLIPLEQKAATSTEEYAETHPETEQDAYVSDFNGVVSERWKYVQYIHEPHAELYDERNDPYELHNLLDHDAASFDAMSPRMQAVVTRLRKALARLEVCAAASCRF